MKKLASVRSKAPRHWVGDGFPVRSVFSYNDAAQALSPFLLLDHAGPSVFEPMADPSAKRRGVGQHPHRGFETVTIVYEGQVEHRDSTGAGGTIGPGDVQWMTAASGIVHEEHHGEDFARNGGPFQMVQLWVNLPARDKMGAPGYQELRDAQMPRVVLPDGAGTLRLISGHFGEARGPARTFSAVDLWDLQLQRGHRVELPRPEGHTTALFVPSGALRLADRDGADRTLGSGELGVLERQGDRLTFDVSEDARVLLLGGAPLNEPVVGHGPFVMNTAQEIQQAFEDYQSGHFLQVTDA